METKTTMPTMADVCRSNNVKAGACGTCGARHVCGGMNQEYRRADPVDVARRKCVMSIVRFTDGGKQRVKCRVCGAERIQDTKFHMGILMCDNGCMVD